MMCLGSFNYFQHQNMGEGVGSDAVMGSNLSKRKSASQGALHLDDINGPIVPPDKYKLCSSLPNHLDVPDNNNETKEQPKLPFPACPLHHTNLIAAYPFIKPERVFSVIVSKGPSGLGLSVCGGEPYPGLVRIKRLFPHQPASMSGRLQQGDILLAASGIPLLGLTNYEALEVLRTSGTEVKLTVCRPPENSIPPPDTPPPPPPPPREHKDKPYGEFEIIMEKVNGSLGFTLRKEDHSVLGHYVRALVREPALSDTRIKPGDKIVAVNGCEMSNLSHEEAVAYLRQCPTQVRLRLYRDPAQTPLPPHSPTRTTRNNQTKPILRKEAQDMLNELASRKSQSPGDSSSSSSSHTKTSSPRKRRLTRTPPPQDGSETRRSSCTEDDYRRRPCQLGVTSQATTNLHFSSNLANQSSEEELVCSGLLDSGQVPEEPVSMPPGLDSSDVPAFSHRTNPAYRSANPTLPSSKPSTQDMDGGTGGCSEQDIPLICENEKGGSNGQAGLLKWKGIVFTTDECETNHNISNTSINDTSIAPPPDPAPHSPSVTSDGNQSEPVDQEYKIVIVELNRGWNSRLGFSLAGAPGGGTIISAVHPDSVASRDGRLRVNDRLINVNDEKIEDMATNDVIDLLRKIRGSICLTLLRKPSDNQ